MTQKVAVLGTGKIGEALLSGMIRGGWSTDDLLVTARRPERAAELQEQYGVEAVSNAEAAKTADTLILLWMAGGPSQFETFDPKPGTDNGGPTETHALVPGSPAIDAAGEECPPPFDDQRGVERPQDGDGDGVANGCPHSSWQVAVRPVIRQKSPPQSSPGGGGQSSAGAVRIISTIRVLVSTRMRCSIRSCSTRCGCASLTAARGWV